ncbi:MAG: ATP synthase F1 subunit epsilon [candidate division WS1 bacterium]|nr:ATP synthase F1 subunit epsilon [candidate division WS1 bacterium]
MAGTFALRVLTPMGEVLSTRAKSLQISAYDGLVGVLARHAPMVTELDLGRAEVVEEDGDRRFIAIVGGVMHVRPDEVVVLTEAAEEAAEIDIERAQHALERARQRLSARERGVDVSRAELAFARALNRLRVAERMKH